MILRLAPGLAAAIVAFALLKLVSWFGWVSLSGEVAVFLVTYLVVAFSTERAMQRYGAREPGAG
jgi:hypothetical protein